LLFQFAVLILFYSKLQEKLKMIYQNTNRRRKNSIGLDTLLKKKEKWCLIWLVTNTMMTSLCCTMIIMRY